MKLDSKSIPDSWKAHDKAVRPYLWSHRVLSLGKSLLGFCLFVYLLVNNRFQVFEGNLSERIANPFLLWLAFFAVISIGWEIITFPFSIAHHWVERSHHLSKQGYVGWLVDKLKGMGLGAVLGVVVMGVLFFCTRFSPEFWWLATCTLFILLSIVLAQLTPVLLIPIFFKLKPMEAGALKERLLKLCERFKINVQEVYHLGLGEKTEKGNAAFVGLGKTKRIIIGDTLYEKFSADEVEAVFAHELGHQVHNDLWKGIFLASGFMFLAFYIAERISTFWVFPAFETDITRPFGLLLFFVVLGFVQMPTGLVQTIFTRYRERLADDFASTKIGTGAMLASALERLTIQNRGLFKPNAIIEFLTHSHPAPWRRIMTLRGSN